MRAYRVKTDRLHLQLVESGPEDGIPVLLIHGNLSTRSSSRRSACGRVDSVSFDGAGHAPESVA